VTRTSAEPGAAPGGGGRRSSIAPRVFYPAGALIVVFVALTVAFPDVAGSVVSAINGSIIGTFGWYYTLIVTAFVVFALWMGFGHLGDIVLGPDDEEPEFRIGPWFAMLFAAGMGIGLVFWGVAEPLNHFASPPPGLTGTP
jgi:choline/glycine/proline betaine transport protein